MKPKILAFLSVILLLSACAAPPSETPETVVPPAVAETHKPSPVDDDLWMKAYTDVLLAASDSLPRMIMLTDMTRDGVPELFFAELGVVNRYILRGFSYSDGKITDIVIPQEWMLPDLEVYRKKGTESLVGIAGDTMRHSAGEYSHEWYTVDFSNLSDVKQEFLFGWVERFDMEKNTWQYLLCENDRENTVISTLEDVLERQEQLFSGYELLGPSGSFAAVTEFITGYDGTYPILTADNLNKPLLSEFFVNWKLSVTDLTPKNRAPVSEPDEAEPWKEVYAGFLREHIPISEADIDAFADDSDEAAWYAAFMAGGYPVNPFFYLYDFDNDGTPELIYIDLYTYTTNGFGGEVYAYRSDTITKVGSIEFYPFGGLGAPLDKTEGLYSDVGYKGHYGEIYLYTIDSGVLTEQMVLECNNRPETSSEHPGLPYFYDNFARLVCYDVTEVNISKVIYGKV